MFFYITEKIGATQYFSGRKLDCSHTKVGIAKSVGDRFKEYNTIVPNISAVRQIFVKKKFGKDLEKMFKYYLSAYRINGSECYAITPKGAIFFLSRCFISKGMVLINLLYKNGKLLFYLDSIYFGKKIPLFIIKMVRKYKKDAYDKNYVIEIIKDWSRKDTKVFLDEKYRKSNYIEVIEDIYDFSHNVLYHLVKRKMDQFQRVIDNWNDEKESTTYNDMVHYFSEQFFWILRDYYKLFKDKKNKKKTFIKEFDFFNKRLESAKKLYPDDRPYYVANIVKNKYFYFLSDMLDERGTNSKNKSDPYQFRSDGYTYWLRFQTSEKKLESLLKKSN